MAVPANAFKEMVQQASNKGPSLLQVFACMAAPATASTRKQQAREQRHFLITVLFARVAVPATTSKTKWRKQNWLSEQYSAAQPAMQS